MNAVNVTGKSGQYKVRIYMGAVDFPLLRRQKLILVKLASRTPIKAHADALEGAIALIDHIQDESVSMGVPQNIVFGKK